MQTQNKAHNCKMQLQMHWAKCNSNTLGGGSDTKTGTARCGLQKYKMQFSTRNWICITQNQGGNLYRIQENS